MEFKVTHEESFCKARLNRVIILENMDFVWDEPQLKQMIKMWKKGTSLEEMAEHFDREEDEVFLALFHLARKDKINRRKGELLG